MGYKMPWYSAQDSTDALLAGRWFGMIVAYLRDGDRVFETYWTSGRAPEVMAPAYGLLDMTVYGRQENFEDSPEGWPQPWENNGGQFRTGGRPTAQWSGSPPGTPTTCTLRGREPDLGAPAARARYGWRPGRLARRRRTARARRRASRAR